MSSVYSLAGLGLLWIAGCGLEVSGVHYHEGAVHGTGGGVPGAGGAGGGQSSASSGMMPVFETDCTDGLDNDSDGNSDCDDSDCTDSGYVCIEQIPAGAQLVYPAGMDGACAEAWTPLPLSACEGCSCTVPITNCTVDIWTYTDSQCSSLYGTQTFTQATCDNINDLSRHAKGLVSPPAGFVCSPDTATIASTAVPVCAAAGSTCGTQGVCVTKTNEKPCVLVSGQAACTAPFTVAKAVFESAQNALCQCACATENMGCAGSDFRFYNGSDYCNGANYTDIPLDGACHNAGYATSAQITLGTATADCTANAKPLAAAEMQTLCCTP